MRKHIIAIIATSLVATSAFADGYRGHGHHGMGWVAPLVGGVVLGTLIAPRVVEAAPPVYTQPAPVYVQPAPVYVQPGYQPMYKFVDVYIPECNCYRSVKVQIN